MNLSINHTDKIGSIAWILLAGAVFITSADLPTGSAETGAGFYPRVVAILIAFFAVLQLGRSIYEGDSKDHEISFDTTKTVVIITTLITVYVLSLPWLGFITGTIIFLSVSMIFSGARSITRVAIASVGLPLLLYYVFTVLLRIPLPESPYLPVEGILPGVILATISGGVI